MQCMVIATCQVLALQYLRILQALSFFLQVAEFEASPGAEVAEAGAVFEQGLSKQSKVVLRSGRVQHGSTWFNDILLPHHCRSCCHWVSLKHNALEVLMRQMVRVKQWNIQISFFSTQDFAFCLCSLQGPPEPVEAEAVGLNNVLSRKLVVTSLIFFIFLPCFRKGCGAVQVPNPQCVMHTLIWIHFFQWSTQLLPT